MKNIFEFFLKFQWFTKINKNTHKTPPDEQNSFIKYFLYNIEYT